MLGCETKAKNLMTWDELASFGPLWVRSALKHTGRRVQENEPVPLHAKEANAGGTCPTCQRSERVSQQGISPLVAR